MRGRPSFGPGPTVLFVAVFGAILISSQACGGAVAWPRGEVEARVRACARQLPDNYCNCLVDRLQQRMSHQQATALMARVGAQDPEAVRTVTDLSKECPCEAAAGPCSGLLAFPVPTIGPTAVNAMPGGPGDQKIVAGQPPVTLSAVLSNAGWMVHLHLADESAREVFYRLDDEADFTSTRFAPMTHPKTGRPVPNSFFTLSPRLATRDSHSLAVKWIDSDGNPKGPYDLRLSLKAELIKHVKHVLDVVIPYDWISFREYPEGTMLVYFSTLLTYKNALKEIRYSIDDRSLSTVFPFEPWVDLSSTPKMTETPYINVPKRTRMLYVKLRYTDGSESETRFFPNTARKQPLAESSDST